MSFDPSKRDRKEFINFLRMLQNMDLSSHCTVCSTGRCISIHFSFHLPGYRIIEYTFTVIVVCTCTLHNEITIFDGLEEAIFSLLKWEEMLVHILKQRCTSCGPPHSPGSRPGSSPPSPAKPHPLASAEPTLPPQSSPPLLPLWRRCQGKEAGGHSGLLRVGKASSRLASLCCPLSRPLQAWRMVHSAGEAPQQVDGWLSGWQPGGGGSVMWAQSWGARAAHPCALPSVQEHPLTVTAVLAGGGSLASLLPSTRAAGGPLSRQAPSTGPL